MIQIKNNLYLDACDTCYILKERKNRVNQRGKTVYEALSYHYDLDQALEEAAVILTRSKVADNTVQTLTELADYFRDLKYYVKIMVKGED